MSDIDSVDIIDNGAAVAVRFGDGRRARFHAAWLRDNATDAATRSPGNGQRLVTLTDIPPDTTIERAEAGAETVSIRFAPDGKTVDFAAPYLIAGIYDRESDRAAGWVDGGIETWDGSLDAGLAVASFDAVREDRESLGRWLALVRRLGFAALSGGPIASGALCDVVALFGFVRETHYGRWFEVVSEVAPVNLAYTNAGLQAHTDNPYRDPVPTLQVLYCLRNSADGGDSLLVDGFRAAARLRDENPAWFDLLSSHCARFEYAGSPGVKLRARRPMIELAPDGELVAVRFNNRSAAPITDVPYDKMADYYRAYRRFAEVIDDPAMAVTLKLEPGECFIVDNTRVLHGRRAYSGAGTRHLQGCYADRDGLLSTLAAIEDQRGERFP